MNTPDQGFSDATADKIEAALGDVVERLGKLAREDHSEENEVMAYAHAAGTLGSLLTPLSAGGDFNVEIRGRSVG